MEQRVKLIVAGTRTFGDAALLERTLDAYTKGAEEVVVLSGGARGADWLGEEWAAKKMHTVLRFHPDWAAYGKGAGPRRNLEMAQAATDCVVFWDGKSSGTKSMLELARKHKLKLKVVRYKSG
jgi:hypothetical protein